MDGPTPGFLKPRHMEWVDQYARQLKLDIKDEEAVDKMVEQFASDLKTELASDINIFGWRTQSMFAFVASSLGNVRIIKGEDAGGIVVNGIEAKPPDFRLVLKDGRQLLIEVKNFSKDYGTPFRIEKSYMAELQAYADAMGVELRIAIWWRKYQHWSLILPSDLTDAGTELTIKWDEAMKRSSMIDLGDMWVGTKPPLVFRMTADVPVTPDIEGHVEMRVGSAELWAAGTRIEDEHERALAWYFMLYGDWQYRKEAVMREDKVIALDHILEPEHWEPRQGFDFVGILSTMISAVFRSRTSKDGRVNKISPLADPASLGIWIPDDYKGEALKLWRMKQVPSER